MTKLIVPSLVGNEGLLGLSALFFFIVEASSCSFFLLYPGKGVREIDTTSFSCLMD